MTTVSYSEGLRELRRQSRVAAREIFQPRPVLTVSEAADTHRILPSTSPFPGRFRTGRLPYMRRIQDVLGDDTTKDIVFAKASQIAGSTVAENFLLYLMLYSPSAVLQVWPSEGKLKKWTLTRLDPMIDDCTALRAKFPRSGRRDSGDSLSYKEFPGGWLKAITAKSTIELKSDTARVAIAEEVDEWDYDLKEQGDPLELLLVRMRNYWNRKLYVPSTPTVYGRSRVWSLLETSTWEEYWVPCPHCDHYQTLRWRDATDDDEEAGAYRILFDRNEHDEVVSGSAKYVCEECAALIEEKHKQQMLDRGQWRPRFPGRETVGFHLNTLYSPFVPWDEVARAFLRAKGNPATMKVFVNTQLGLPYREKGETVSTTVLSNRAERYDAEIPRGVGLLTAGVDVQGDRLELLVWGWGAGERSWMIRWEQLDGDPGQDDVWSKLDEWILKREFQHVDGAKMKIAATCLDAGYHTERAWRYCAARAARRVLATVGRAGRGRKLIEAPTPEKYKRSRSRKKPMHVVGVDSGKDLLYARLRIKDADVPGYVHFPDNVDPVFYDQLTSEQLTTQYREGRPQRVWTLIAGRRNEALDMTVLNMAALAYLGIPTIRQLGELAERISAIGKAGPDGAAKRGPRRMISKGLHG
jgi:phage terminase large subunit GpA-like protein